MDISYLSCKNKLKVLNYDPSILPLKEISHKETKIKPISHEKNTHLGKSYVTMTDLMVKFYKNTELSGFICEEFSKSSGLTSKANFEKNHY